MSDLSPEHPIALPPDTPPDQPPDQPDAPVDVPPEAPGETLDFFQRTTLGFNWAPASIGSEGETVAVDAWEGEVDGDGKWLNVRSVPNSGSSSVTYPSDFTGDVAI